jgi:hypothetical protein
MPIEHIEFNLGNRYGAKAHLANKPDRCKKLSMQWFKPPLTMRD